MRDYWNNRFNNEGYIWGEEPSKTVIDAKRLFALNDVKTILVPGAGYGRNTKILSDTFQVDAIEISTEAINLAREWDKRSYFIEGSIFELSTSNKCYDAIYCYDLLHLFAQIERIKLIETCVQHLNKGGLYYFTCFSNEDESFGVGQEIEENTFEYKKGKISHFFSEDDLIRHFKETEIIETGKVEEVFEYSDNSIRTYKLRYIYGQKK
ncbi:bifunctional 2-polyprenyl-6-hydroxyphenol methylase/3-demethylubiquinol 3-O-methyltransferase UbiG [Cohnella sp. AR92]|uniref:class I SAM-dependent methyltransferase n=1 Tax=Cohnella sp. AR92 TaxID=648716 RepID=UPI000F8C7A7B|nr:class I SAM-dependent methyltransferase [Cohnella sp. AR92]RUS45856.1 class I SAM-dependent methyltransferase [Cohnella sp. AR92]